MSNAIVVTDADFEANVEKAEGLTVVDFWATWCGPCRMIAPILDQLSVEYAGKVKVTKLDVDSNQKTSMKFNVRSIPTLLFFKDGKLVDQVVGAVPKAALAEKFKLPVHYIGVGETRDDLEPFAARDFARAIAGLEDEA